MEVSKVEFHMLVVGSVEKVVALSVSGIETRVVGTRERPVTRLRTIEDKLTGLFEELTSGPNPKVWNAKCQMCI